MAGRRRFYHGDASSVTDHAPPGQECGYCRSGDYAVVQRFDATYMAVRCGGCGLVRTYPYPVFDYEDNKGYALGYGGREELFHRFARDFLAFVRRHAPGPRLLEVGSGMGFLLDEAAPRGFIARGLEINRWEVEMTRARGLDVGLGTLEQAGLAPDSVDVVCMSHVLEHVADLRSLLIAAHRVLVPGGVLAICQPHYAAPLVRALRHRWYGWQWEQHLWHFDVPSATAVLTANGFERVAVTLNSLHHPWLPIPFTTRPKTLAVQCGTAAVARAEAWLGRGDQFYLAARSVDLR